MDPPGKILQEFYEGLGSAASVLLGPKMPSASKGYVSGSQNYASFWGP